MVCIWWCLCLGDKLLWPSDPRGEHLDFPREVRPTPIFMHQGSWRNLAKETKGHLQEHLSIQESDYCKEGLPLINQGGYKQTTSQTATNRCIHLRGKSTFGDKHRTGAASIHFQQTRHRLENCEWHQWEKGKQTIYAARNTRWQKETLKTLFYFTWKSTIHPCYSDFTISHIVEGTLPISTSGVFNSWTRGSPFSVETRWVKRTTNLALNKVY